MLRTLHKEHGFSDMFVAYVVDRHNHTQADLVDQLFNSSEKRLARALLILARFGKDGRSELVIPGISQETLAEMIGTTRPRVNFWTDPLNWHTRDGHTFQERKREWRDESDIPGSSSAWL